MSTPERQNSRQSAASPPSGTQTPKRKSRAADGRTEPRIRSVLIEPRHNEPPRISVSVEYEGRAPGVQALQKAAMEAVHSVVRREGKLEDLGYRHQQKSRELVQTFEVRGKGSK